MLHFLNNTSLKKYNTFGIDVNASLILTFDNENDLHDAQFHFVIKKQPFFILGGGSNLLFTADFNGLLIHPLINDISIVNETSDALFLKVGAGVVWDDFVAYCVENNWMGAENLSAIPGHVGAAPVQNVGAYGVEAADIIHAVRGYNLVDYQFKEMTRQECAFGYRDSIFKHQLKNQFIVTYVIFKLSKKPAFNINYAGIQEKLDELGGCSLQNIRKAIVDIRTHKLPDPAVLGSAGSFFKNPVVDNQLIQQLLLDYPQMPVYPVDDAKSKIAAGWLIEKAGWKGFRQGDAAVHHSQALVLVNHANASGADIVNLAQNIEKSVFKQFNIKLEREVILLPN